MTRTLFHDPLSVLINGNYLTFCNGCDHKSEQSASYATLVFSIYIESIVLERAKLSELLKVARSRKSCPKVAEHLRDSVPQTVFNLIPPLIHFQESSMITTVLESSGVAKASTMTLEFSFVTLHTSVRH